MHAHLRNETMSLVNRLCVFAVVATAVACSTVNAAETAAAAKPNILIIVADDK